MLLVTLFVIALVTLLLYGIRKTKYWEQKKITYEKPLPFVGNVFDLYLAKRSLIQIAADLYNKYPNEKVVGLFRRTQPVLLLRDPELVKRVLATDFYNFHHRGVYPNKDAVEPLMRNLFFADGDLWRLLRYRMTPAFTSGKLKAMFPLICERAERLQSVIGTSSHDQPRTLDARDIMARFTTDFIGAIGFGIDSDSLNNENSAFRELGKKIFDTSFGVMFAFFMKDMFPQIGKYMKYTYHVEDEIIGLAKQIQKQRNYEPSGRNDFIDLLLESKKKGALVGESIEKIKQDGSPETATIELDDELFAAQMYIFFAAGFETSSSTSSYTLHELAYNPEIQKKVQEEIHRVLAKYDGKLCYDAVSEMTYLGWAFKESMRIFPSVGVLNRECVKKCTIPELDLDLEPGVAIMVSVQAMHNDPQYFENPEEFRPERFSADEFNDVQKMVYMPFGLGPRTCIGERLGQMQALAGLVAILSKFSVEPAPESRRKPISDPKADITQSILGGLPLIFRQSKV